MNSKSIYENVPIIDEHDSEGSLSATEVDESLIGDEKAWHHQRASKRKSCMAIFKSYRWIIDTTLLLVIIGLLLLLRNEWGHHEPPSAELQIGGDYSRAAVTCMFSYGRLMMY